MRHSLIVATSFMAASSFVAAQDTNGGWRRIGESQPQQQLPPQQADPNDIGSGPADAQRPPYDAQRPPYDAQRPPYDAQRPQFDGQRPPADANNFPPPPPPNLAPLSPQLTVRPGSFLTVRINQRLSSDRNQEGDSFSATLVEPVVVDGYVVAQSGQTLAGRVVDAKKAGRVEGTSRLGIQLTELTAVDGQVLPISTQLINRNGRTSEGRDAAAVAGTTALGAALGAAVGWGSGAAIGAGAGAGAGIIGVLLTRGEPTVVGPESVLTFRVEQPVTVSTERAPQAFRPVDSSDYARSGALQTRQAPPPRPAYGPYYGNAYPSPYPYPYYAPYYYRPGVSIFFGSRYYGPRGYYRRYR
jgi:hypothetical protein